MISILKRRMLVEEAEKWTFVRESGRSNCGKEVEMFQGALGFPVVRQPWCLAFVQYCVHQVDKNYVEELGFDICPTQIYHTQHVMTLWNKTPKNMRMNNGPEMGYLMVWEHWKDGRPTGMGHVGIVVNVIDGNTMECIEGNTGPGVGVQRTGDGVYRKTRVIGTIGDMKFKGFIKVWDDNIIDCDNVDK